jgi:hypothetical protein
VAASGRCGTTVGTEDGGGVTEVAVEDAAPCAWVGAGTGDDGGSSRKSPDPEASVTDSEGTGSAGRLICEGRDRCDSYRW